MNTTHLWCVYGRERSPTLYSPHPRLPGLQALDAGRLPQWTNLPAPEIGLSYWRLPEGSNMRDLLLAVRADEVGGWPGGWVGACKLAVVGGRVADSDGWRGGCLAGG